MQAVTHTKPTPAMTCSLRLRAAQALASSCNAHINWSVPAAASSCSQGGKACSLGEVWGVSSLHASAATAATGTAEAFVQAQQIIAATPMAPDSTAGAEGRMDLMTADACRFVRGSGVLSRSMLAASKDVEGGAAACLAKVTPTDAQMLALLRATYVGGDFAINTTGVSSSAIIVPSLNETSGAQFCRRCMCRGIMYSRPELWRDSLSSAIAPDGSGACDHQLGREMLDWVLEAVVVSIVVGCNALLRTVVVWLSRFKRVKLVSQLEATIARSVFVGQFANTALVTLLVYARVEQVSDSITHGLRDMLSTVHGLDDRQREDVLKRIVSLLPFSGRYQDLNAQWYGTAGTALVITFTSNIVLPLLPLLLGVGNRMLLSCWCCLRGIYTRRSLARRLQAPCFQLGARYGLLLNLVFTSSLLTPGMPVLWLVAAVLFTATFFVDKLVLLRFSRTPVNYSKQIAEASTGYLQYAVLLHMVMSVWTFSTSTQLQSGSPSLPLPSSPSLPLPSSRSLPPSPSIPPSLPLHPFLAFLSFLFTSPCPCFLPVLPRVPASKAVIFHTISSLKRMGPCGTGLLSDLASGSLRILGNM